MKDNYGYRVYCTLHLLEVLGLIDKEMACDERYELAEKIYNDFLQSEYSANQKSEYDCIEDYIKEEVK
jgi:hypothetical protein